MIDSNGYVMSADRQVVRIENGLVVDVDKQFAPLHFINGKDFTSWLEGLAQSKLSTFEKSASSCKS